MNRFGRTSRRRLRNNKAVAIAEAAAALSILLPILAVVLFSVIEATYACIIKTILNEVAQVAARSLSVSYGNDPTIASDRSAQDTQVFNGIRVTAIVNASQQFDNPVFNVSASPPTVSVTVRYLGGKYGLSPFPNPDPLGLGSAFVLSSTATYSLE